MASKKMPAARQEKILKWLEEEGSLSIAELQSRLGVSHMTVHRDLAQLSRTGRIDKVRGGALLKSSSESHDASRPTCSMCKRSVTRRQEFIIRPVRAEQLTACCPHCGIMLLTDVPSVDSSLARDFLYGHMVNVYQAYYVIAPAVRLCCEPTVLCFARQADAENFGKGFGGLVMDFFRAKSYLTSLHHKEMSDPAR